MLISTAQYTHCHKAALHTAVLKLLKRACIVKCDDHSPDPSPNFSSIFDFVNHSCFETSPALLWLLGPRLSFCSPSLFTVVVVVVCLFPPLYQLLTVGFTIAPKSLSLAPTSPLSFRSDSQHSASFLHLIVARSLKLTTWQ